MTREANTQRSATAAPAIAALLAARAGGVDTLAFFGVGKAFAGIVTGNLVTAGYGLAHGDGLVDLADHRRRLQTHRNDARVR